MAHNFLNDPPVAGSVLTTLQAFSHLTFRTVCEAETERCSVFQTRDLRWEQLSNLSNISSLGTGRICTKRSANALNLCACEFIIQQASRLCHEHLILLRSPPLISQDLPSLLLVTLMLARQASHGPLFLLFSTLPGQFTHSNTASLYARY